MEVVTLTEKAIGSFDWELPENVSKMLEKLPEDERARLKKMIELSLRGDLKVLLAVLLEPGLIETFLRERQSLAERLLALSLNP